MYIVSNQRSLVPQCSIEHLDLFPDDIHYGPLNLMVAFVDTCLPQSISAAVVSDLMTGKLSAVIIGGKWERGVRMR